METRAGETNIQDSYLAKARKERVVLTIILNSGKKIAGRIRSFDRYTILLEDRGGEQMVFKHAIATISKARAFANPIPIEKGGKDDEPSPAGA